MSKIRNLLTQLNTNTIKEFKISEIAEVSTGRTNGNQAVENGEYPLYVRSKDIKRIDFYEFDEDAIVIPGEGGVGEIFHRVSGKYSLHQRAYRVHIINNEISTDYISLF